MDCEGSGVKPGRIRRQSIRSRSPVRRSTMADKNKVAEQYYTPPPILGKWESLRIFLWNSETGQFLGRTGSSWGKIHSNFRNKEAFGGKNRWGVGTSGTDFDIGG